MAPLLVAVSVLATCSCVNMLQTAFPIVFLPELNQTEAEAVRQFRTEELSQLSRPDLVRVWHTLPPPTYGRGLAGFHRGEIIRVGPLHPASRVLTHRLFGPGLWEGKRLSPRNGRGENVFVERTAQSGRRGGGGGGGRWGRGAKKTRDKPFKMSIGPSCIDKKPCLVLDYGNAAGGAGGGRGANSFPWCTMRDELREVRPGVLLGMGGMGATLGNLNSAMFTLSRGGRKSPPPKRW